MEVKTDMALFEEIYGSYFQAVRKILEKAAVTAITEKDMIQIVRACAFEESPSSIVPKLIRGPWSSLLRREKGDAKAWRSSLSHSSLKTPLTGLQKAWLKSLLEDRRFRLFFSREQLDCIAGELKETEPLFDLSDFYYFDRYEDGDDYESALYRQNFQTVLGALTKKKPLIAAYESGKGNSMTMEVLPCRLQYSFKNDKFRLLALEFRHGRTGRPVTLNLGRIRACHLSRRLPPKRFAPESAWNAGRDMPSVQIRIQNERNALERCMLHFAHYDKQTSYEPESDTWLCSIWYDSADETELLIELLSFGPVLRVLGPENFLEQVQDRVLRQHELLYRPLEDGEERQQPE